MIAARRGLAAIRRESCILKWGGRHCTPRQMRNGLFLGNLMIWVAIVWTLAKLV